MRTQLHITGIPRRVLALSALIGALVVIGCSGGSQNSSTPVAPVTYTIGGTISGLSGTGLVLQDNGGNSLTVSAGAASFTFSTAIASGGAYSVTVLAQPSNPAQYCAVKSGGSGTVANANVTSVAISCTNTFTIGGTISGLTGTGLVLQANNANYLSVSAGANTFTFTTPFISGVGYAVTIFAQPHNPPQTCTVTDGSVFVSSANVTSVVVNCVDSIGFDLTGSMTNSRAGHTATLLNNGQVLIAGGSVDDGGDITASAELYDPATKTFADTGSMTTTRGGHTATLLFNGQVLITGGVDDDNDELASAELYDPATGTFIATGSMSTARDGQTATLLNSGNVLVAGGFASSSPLASAELYLPVSLTPTGLVSITVTPAAPTLSAGSTQQFVAMGTFSDGSTQILQSVTWSSSNQAACTITNDASDHGVALALAAGKCTITASAGSISGSAVLTVQ